MITEDRLLEMEKAPREAEIFRAEMRELAEVYRYTNQLLRQIEITDFVDDIGHNAKMLKPVHDLTKVLAG